LQRLAEVLSGGDTDITLETSEDQLLAQHARGYRHEHRLELGERPVAAFGAAGVGLIEDALHVEDDERDRCLHPRAQGLGAFPQDQVGRVGPLRKLDHAQLELVTGGGAGRTEHRLLAGAVGVQTELEHPDDAHQLGELLVGEGGAHDPHRVAQTGLMERQHIRVSLDQDHAAGARGMSAGEVDAEQLPALVE